LDRLEGAVNRVQRLSDGVRRCQQLVCSRPHSDIFGEIFPAHRSRAIDQELRWAGDICSSGTSAWMQQLVTPNHVGLRVRKKWERVAPFVAEIFRNFRRINANGDWQDSLRLKFR